MNDPPVLYQRAKCSDMVQGLADMVRLMRLEVQKIEQFHGTVINSYQFNYSGYNQFRSSLDQMFNYTLQLDDMVKEMKLRGL